MKELFRRLGRCPLITTEILISTFFVTVLNLASPIFVIQVLNRFVSSGSIGTLITLVGGMMAAIVLQFAFRIVRTKIASEISVEPDLLLSRRVLHVLTWAKTLPLGLVPKATLQETINGLQVIKSTYNAHSINAVIDAPFALLFIGASFLISPMLAFISFMGVLMSLLAGGVTIVLSTHLTKKLQKQSIAQRGFVMSIANAIDTVRAFHGEDFLHGIWGKQVNKANTLEYKDAGVKELSQTILLTINVLMSVLLYSVGALEVLDGSLSTGALIGANILAGRAFSSTTKFVQIIFMQMRAAQMFSELNTLFKMPLEASKGTALKEYSGTLEFMDLGFAYPRATGPLFESLDLKIAPGQIMAISGYNGSGKTTLSRLMVGLLEPVRGSVMIDKVNLRQVAMPWWREQIVYLPQEPTFVNATIAETITMPNKELDLEAINKIIDLVDLRGFIDASATGLDTRVFDNGRELPVGIRKRIALARALANNGKLVVFDEPTEGLDDRGVEAIYTILNAMAKARKTIIVVTRDPKILKGANIILDLSEKPVPVIVRNN